MNMQKLMILLVYCIHRRNSPLLERAPKAISVFPPFKKKYSPSGKEKKTSAKSSQISNSIWKKTKIHLPECCCLRGCWPQSFPLFRCWSQNFQAVRVHHHVGENLDLVDFHEEPEIPLWQLQHLLNLLSLPQEFFLVSNLWSRKGLWWFMGFKFYKCTNLRSCVFGDVWRELFVEILGTGI